LADGNDGDRQVDESRSDRKRKTIVEAGLQVFLSKGYLGTSVDEIAAAASVSKQTVYKHFTDKERLFTEIILNTIDQVGEPFYEGIDALPETDDLERDLGELGRRLIRIVMQPQLLRLRRLVIGEAARFPDLGRAYFERGPGRTVETLATRFGRLAERNLLRTDDPMLAAQHFLYLVVSISLYEVMLSGNDDRFTPAELERFADEGLRVFLAAYAEPGPERTRPRASKRSASPSSPSRRPLRR